MKKIGLLDLDQGGLQSDAKAIFQTMWADNGDAISRQYAGTDAMKVSAIREEKDEEERHRFQGDFTRTGRRDIKGVWADGKISANRYYRRFKKDTLRQQCYDAMQKQISVISDTNKASTVTATVVPDFENNNELVRSFASSLSMRIKFPLAVDRPRRNVETNYFRLPQDVRL